MTEKKNIEYFLIYDSYFLGRILDSRFWMLDKFQKGTFFFIEHRESSIEYLFRYLEFSKRLFEVADNIIHML